LCIEAHLTFGRGERLAKLMAASAAALGCEVTGE
jgi:hypothetical protein